MQIYEYYEINGKKSSRNSNIKKQQPSELVHWTEYIRPVFFRTKYGATKLTPSNIRASLVFFFSFYFILVFFFHLTIYIFIIGNTIVAIVIFIQNLPKNIGSITNLIDNPIKSFHFDLYDLGYKYSMCLMVKVKLNKKNSMILTSKIESQCKFYYKLYQNINNKLQSIFI